MLELGLLPCRAALAQQTVLQIGYDRRVALPLSGRQNDQSVRLSNVVRGGEQPQPARGVP